MAVPTEIVVPTDCGVAITGHGDLRAFLSAIMKWLPLDRCQWRLFRAPPAWQAKKQQPVLINERANYTAEHVQARLAKYRKLRAKIRAAPIGASDQAQLWLLACRWSTWRAFVATELSKTR